MSNSDTMYKVSVTVLVQNALKFNQYVCHGVYIADGVLKLVTHTNEDNEKHIVGVPLHTINMYEVEPIKKERSPLTTRKGKKKYILRPIAVEDIDVNDKGVLKIYNDSPDEEEEEFWETFDKDKHVFVREGTKTVLYERVER